MTPTPHTSAALLLHRERVQDAMRYASYGAPRRKRFGRMNRSPLLRLA
jgi:hypothetical protein